jgi:hypothetical protein
MKKIAFFTLLAMGISFALLLLMNPQEVSGSMKYASAGPGTDLPDSVMMVFQKACMDCHADDGSSMARSKVNFSKWNTYDAEKQVKKANAICKELTKGDMPPKKWRANNPDDVPTQTEIDKICLWAKGLQK